MHEDGHFILQITCQYFRFPWQLWFGAFDMNVFIKQHKNNCQEINDIPCDFGENETD